MKIVIQSKFDGTWGVLNRILIAGLSALGHEVYVKPLSDTKDLPEAIKQRISTGKHEVPFELILSTPDHLPTKGKKTIYLTKYCEGMEMAALKCLNLADLIVVPSQWDRQKFQMFGIKQPIEVVRMYHGLPSDPQPMDTKGVCVFGATLRQGDQIEKVIRAFDYAFGKPDLDVKLMIRSQNDAWMATSDQRIIQHHKRMPWFKTQQWYAGLTAYISIGDGFGLSTIEAHQHLRPVMALPFGSRFSHGIEYPLLPEKKGSYQFDWKSLALQMRRVYLARNEAARIEDDSLHAPKSFADQINRLLNELV